MGGTARRCSRSLATVNPPPQRHHSIASEAGAGCGFMGQVAPVATKYRSGREARRASICGRQLRRERTRFHRERDEFQAQDLDSDSSSTANPSTIVRCQYSKLVRIRSGSAVTQKTGRFSSHRETPRRISALQDPLSASFFSEYLCHRDQFCSFSWPNNA